MSIQDQAISNMDALRANPYPGRGIVIGQTPDGSRMVQVYWIMGRSDNSRNRIFVDDGETVRTAPHDASKVEDPSLIIYNCTRVCGRAHIVTNGDQTDTIYDALVAGQSTDDALHTRTYEPDAPNYTPRISGLIDQDAPVHAYTLSLLKTIDNDPSRPLRAFYNYERAIAGIGHFVSTYDGDGNPLPSFSGEPRPVQLLDDIDATRDLYWDALNNDNKVSLLVKHIGSGTGSTETRLVNKHAG